MSVITKEQPLNESKWIKFNRVKIEIIATVVANVLSLGQGANAGWLSPSLPILMGVDSPLSSGPITNNDVGWIGSLISLGAIFGTLLFGLLANRIGTKYGLILCPIPTLISWVIVIFAQEAWHLYMARFIVGFTGGGLYICFPMYIAEVASDHIRGRLSATMMMCFNTGVVLGYTFGSYLEYTIVPYIMFVLPILFLLLISFMPNTPQHLLKNNRIEDAEKSLRFYRNCNDSSSYDRERLREEFERFQQIAKQNEQTPPVVLADFTNRNAIKGMIIGPTLMAVSQFSGTFTISSYAAIIFTESGSALPPNLSAIVIGTVQIFGTYTASTLIDRLGRKMLLLISTSCSALALVVTAIYTYLGHTGHDVTPYNVLPVISISIYIYVSAAGIIPVPYVLVNEMFPRKIRKIAATVCTCTVSIFAFIMLKTFPLLLAALSLYACLAIFACVSVFGIVFTMLTVPETKGKNLDTLIESNTNEIQMKP